MITVPGDSGPRALDPIGPGRTTVTLYGFQMTCQLCGGRITVHECFVPTGLPGWDPNCVVLSGCGPSLEAADGALSAAARAYNSVGGPVPTMIGDEHLLVISCGHCGAAITSEMRMEAEIAEDADGYYEIERTTMANDTLEAALKASETAGIFIVKGGIHPRSTTTRLVAPTSPAGSRSTPSTPTNGEKTTEGTPGVLILVVLPLAAGVVIVLTLAVLCCFEAVGNTCRARQQTPRAAIGNALPLLRRSVRRPTDRPRRRHRDPAPPRPHHRALCHRAPSDLPVHRPRPPRRQNEPPQAMAQRGRRHHHRRQIQEVEHVRVFRELPRQIGIGRR